MGLVLAGPSSREGLLLQHVLTGSELLAWVAGVSGSGARRSAGRGVEAGECRGRAGWRGDRTGRPPVGAAAVEGDWGPCLGCSRGSWFRTSVRRTASHRKEHLPFSVTCDSH